MDNSFGIPEDNNNVDENSNDHQYNDFANFHYNYGQINYREEPNYNSNDNEAREEAAVRARVYQRINGAPAMNNDITDNAQVQLSLPRRNSVISNSHHRRNLSEDLQIRSYSSHEHSK